MKRVIVIGGGAAGCMAAHMASFGGAKVTLIEKNEKIGKKIYITGKGRCNLTNACDPDDFFENIINNSKFMFSSFYGFDNNFVQDLFESNGCTLKIERGNRVFPVSDKSADVLDSLRRILKNDQVDIRLNTTVTSVSEGCVFTNKGKFEADAVIIATGGISYPSTGSTGDGYKFAKDLGHAINEPKPALVPLVTMEDDSARMQGLSLKNVSVKLDCDKKIIYKGFGEMLFTHFGVSGPLILSASSHYVKKCNGREAILTIDLKPALDEKMLDERIQKDFSESLNKEFKNSLNKLLPSKMIPIVIERTGINEYKKVNEITKEERRKIANVIKNFTLTIKGTRPFEEAIITQGGICVKDINPSTMESKKCPGIYFAGEVLDVDALTGGFNLQVAWSTGALAGISASSE